MFTLAKDFIISAYSSIYGVAADPLSWQVSVFRFSSASDPVPDVYTTADYTYFGYVAYVNSDVVPNNFVRIGLTHQDGVFTFFLGSDFVANTSGNVVVPNVQQLHIFDHRTITGAPECVFYGYRIKR